MDEVVDGVGDRDAQGTEATGDGGDDDIGDAHLRGDVGGMEGPGTAESEEREVTRVEPPPHRAVRTAPAIEALTICLIPHAVSTAVSPSFAPSVAHAVYAAS